MGWDMTFRLTVAAAGLAGALVLGATPTAAATYVFSGSTTVPNTYAGPEPDIADILGMTAASVVSFTATLSDVATTTGADYKNYFATTFSVKVDGIEIISDTTGNSDAYFSISRFDVGDPTYNADIVFFDFRRSGATGFAAYPIDLQLHMRFAAVFGAFGPDLALPTDTSFLASARPGDAAHTELFGYGVGLNDPFFRSRSRTGLADDLSVTQVAAPSAAPEPATWALLLIGFGASGAALRARRRLAAA